MRILDLFCGAGGAGAGYARAGWEVVGVDIDPQPRYPFPFHRADALTFPLDGFDAVHASPPCQRFSKSVSKRHRQNHPDLIGPIRERLLASGLPFVIENVPRAPLHDPIVLCGTMFRLDVKRHRLFEIHGWTPPEPPPCRHADYEPRFAPAWNRTTPLRFRPISGGWTGDDDLEADKAAMGVDWTVNQHELSEAIPPAYTAFLGAALADQVRAREGQVMLPW